MLVGLANFRGQLGMVSRWMNNANLPSYLRQHPEVDRCRMVSFLVPPGSLGQIHGDPFTERRDMQRRNLSACSGNRECSSKLMLYHLLLAISSCMGISKGYVRRRGL